MNYIQRIASGVSNRNKIMVKKILTLYFRIAVGKMKFCIISNDCWGAEMYKLLNRQFNTPFIGLMLMSPCYIKMLENPKYYLNLPLNFIRESKYEEMQAIKAGEKFPLAILGDSGIEIHFLHYQTDLQAKEKWQKRLNRIDWNHLFIKFDCSKDYADRTSVKRFLDLPYNNKLLFGKENFGFEEVLIVKNSPYNAVKQFRSCFLTFNPIGWIKNKKNYSNGFQKYIGKLAFKYI